MRILPFSSSISAAVCFLSFFSYGLALTTCNRPLPPPFFSYQQQFAHLFFFPSKTNCVLTSTTCDAGLFLIPAAVYFQLLAMRTHLSIPPHQLRLVFSPPAVYFQPPAMRVPLPLLLHQLRFTLPLLLLRFIFNYLQWALLLFPHISCNLHISSFFLLNTSCGLTSTTCNPDFLLYQLRFIFNHLQCRHLQCAPPFLSPYISCGLLPPLLQFIFNHLQCASLPLSSTSVVVCLSPSFLAV